MGKKTNYLETSLSQRLVYIDLLISNARINLSIKLKDKNVEEEMIKRLDILMEQNKLAENYENCAVIKDMKDRINEQRS